MKTKVQGFTTKRKEYESRDTPETHEATLQRISKIIGWTYSRATRINCYSLYFSSASRKLILLLVSAAFETYLFFSRSAIERQCSFSGDLRVRL